MEISNLILVPPINIHAESVRSLLNGIDRHTRCMGISNKSYENLANLSTVWICSCCGVANFTQSLFIQDQLNETLNSFSSLTPTELSYLNSTSPLFGTSTQQSSSPPRKHRHTSSTPNPKPQCQRPRGRSSKLHCMEINCNSIMSSERAAFDRFHSRGQQLCKFIGTKESFYIRREFNSHRIWFGTPKWPPFHCFGTPIWPP